MNPPSYPLFQRFGVELEYMIVHERTLNIQTIADQLIQRETGQIQSDVSSRGLIEWSNELALHVIEFKTGRPTPKLDHLPNLFQTEVQHVNQLLASLHSQLLPTAMHPWMNPHKESKLWPHDCADIYATFDRIFSCKGHGWTNLQSVHLNLPFANDTEFTQLHSAIRLALPLLPALAASSPFVDGRKSTRLDTRLHVYQHNCDRIPAVTAGVIPEAILSPADYQKRILNRIQRAVRPFDPDNTLEPEWTNARGAIARFCRNTIEVRVLDVQECPQADLAIVAFLVEILKSLTLNGPSNLQQQLRIPGSHLKSLLQDTIRLGPRAKITSPAIRNALGLPSKTNPTVGQTLQRLLQELAPSHAWWRPAAEIQTQLGPLSSRILKHTGPKPSATQLLKTYRQLANCLQQGELFLP